MPRGRKRSGEPRPEVTPFAWRDPDNGVLYIETPYRRDFTTMLKDCVGARYRAYWQTPEGRKLWLVASGYARRVEDLLEAFWPEIEIDYQGWNPRNDVITDEFIPAPVHQEA